MQHSPSNSVPLDSLNDADRPQSEERPSKRKKITNACTRCQQGKAKCDGGTPCGRCARRNVKCVYNKEQDGRRTVAVRQQLVEYRKDADLLNDLIEAVRNSPADRVPHLVDLMRSGSPIETVKRRIDEELNVLQAAAGLRILHDPVATEWTDRQIYRKDVLQVQRLVDSPPHRVPCRPWTTVTDDDDLVSHLISIWLTWDKPWYNWMDEHLFLRDMRRGRLESSYCSPFLVNCILAWACPYSDYHEARTTNGAISQLMQSFLTEAKRLLEEEMTKPPDLPATQGTAFLYLTLSLIGQDRLGYSFMLQTVAMCEELERCPPTIDDVEEAQSLARTISLTCWGIYNMTTASFIAFMRPQIMRKPKSEPPEPKYNDMWAPYPRQGNATPSRSDELFQVYCDVEIIAASLTHLLFDDTNTIPKTLQEAKVITLHGRLLERLAMMPSHLQLSDEAPASVLAHHVWYQVVVLRMYLALRSHDHSPSVVRQAHSICVETALRVSEIIRLHMRLYGPDLMINIYTQAISLSTYILLDTPPTPQHNLAIISFCICLRSLSRRWPMVMGIFRMVQHYAKQTRYVLPLDADRLFLGFEDDWKRRQTKRLSSLYPQPAVAAHTLLNPGDVKDMGRFLQQMENLELVGL